MRAVAYRAARGSSLRGKATRSPRRRACALIGTVPWPPALNNARSAPAPNSARSITACMYIAAASITVPKRKEPGIDELKARKPIPPPHRPLPRCNANTCLYDADRAGIGTAILALYEYPRLTFCMRHAPMPARSISPLGIVYVTETAMRRASTLNCEL